MTKIVFFHFFYIEVCKNSQSVALHFGGQKCIESTFEYANLHVSTRRRRKKWFGRTLTERNTSTRRKDHPFDQILHLICNFQLAACWRRITLQSIKALRVNSTFVYGGDARSFYFTFWELDLTINDQNRIFPFLTSKCAKIVNLFISTSVVKNA